MVDLKSQYKKIEKKVKRSVLDVFNSTSFINGPEVQKFSEELQVYLDVKHIIPCANGTDALQLALMSLDLQPGDEIITTDFTFVATVEVIKLLKLTYVLVDVEEDSFTIDINAVKQAITPKTKAIIPVHLFGRCANMEALIALAREHNLYIIEDNAQAIGAEIEFSNGIVKKAGTIGDIGTTSFFPSKNLGCFGDGGALFTNSDNLAEKLRSIANHGMRRKYYHDEIGVNSRLDSVQAAILRVKLPFLDNYNSIRREVASKYNKAFKDIPEILVPTFGCGKVQCECDKIICHVFHQYTLRVNNNKRDDLIKYLTNREIPCNIYYPIPLHNQEAYRNECFNKNTFPITDTLVKEVISLPMHTELDNEQINYIIEAIQSYFN